MEEKDFKKIMEFSKLEIQFPNFEEEVMESIRKKEAEEKSFWRNIRWSWFIFLTGLILGLITTDILSDFGLQYFGEKSKLVLLVVEILIVVVFGLQFDNLIRLTFRRKNW
jgi:hypothetical protein